MDSKSEKLHKKALQEQQKRIKPGECQKYVRLVLDLSITSTPLGQELLRSLQQANIKYDTRILSNAQCLLWERSVGQRTLQAGISATQDNSSGGGLSEEWQQENIVFKLLPISDLKAAIKKQNLHSFAQHFINAFPNMQQTIVLLQEKEKNASNNNAIADAMIELQVLHQMNVLQCTDEVKELLPLLQRYTKSIAEAPFKRQKSETLDTFKKYLANDKKQCVRVEGMQGFGRLWQQHLNRLPLVTLEVAETVIAQYSCPKRLLEEYDNNSNAIQTIGDLKISHGGPKPLQTDRRIGNVLSGKLHTLYTTRDPNTLV